MKQVLLSELEYEFSIRPSDMEGLGDILLGFKGKATLWDEEICEDCVVARIKGSRIDITLARKLFDDLEDLFDSISPEVAELGSHILSDNNCYVDSFSKDESEEIPCSGLIYIDEIIVEAAYRNNNIGKEMLKRMSQVVDMNNALVALKAFPITDDKSNERSPELKRQLKNFYTKLGFHHSGEHFMVKDARDCHTQQMRVQAEDAQLSG